MADSISLSEKGFSIGVAGMLRISLAPTWLKNCFKESGDMFNLSMFICCHYIFTINEKFLFWFHLLQNFYCFEKFVLVIFTFLYLSDLLNKLLILFPLL